MAYATVPAWKSHATSSKRPSPARSASMTARGSAPQSRELFQPPSRLWLWTYICNASQQLQIECTNKSRRSYARPAKQCPNTSAAATPGPQNNAPPRRPNTVQGPQALVAPAHHSSGLFHKPQRKSRLSQRYFRDDTIPYEEMIPLATESTTRASPHTVNTSLGTPSHTKEMSAPSAQVTLKITKRTGKMAA